MRREFLIDPDRIALDGSRNEHLKHWSISTHLPLGPRGRREATPLSKKRPPVLLASMPLRLLQKDLLSRAATLRNAAEGPRLTKPSALGGAPRCVGQIEISSHAISRSKIVLGQGVGNRLLRTLAPEKTSPATVACNAGGIHD
jgi:hypothetical protein